MFIQYLCCNISICGVHRCFFVEDYWFVKESSALGCEDFRQQGDSSADVDLSRHLRPSEISPTEAYNAGKV